MLLSTRSVIVDAELEISGKYFPSSFTVIDQDNNDCLLGLDWLKRYQVRRMCFFYRVCVVGL